MMEERRVEIALLGQKVEDLTDKLGKLEVQMQTLLDEWHRANGALSFIKWIASAGAIISFIASILHFGGSK